MVRWELGDWLKSGDSRFWDDAVRGIFSTQCVLYSVYAVLGGNSWWWPGEIVSHDLPSCSQVIVELKMIRREMRRYGTNHQDELGLRECLVWFILPFLMWQVHVCIWCVIKPIRGLPNPISHVVPLISHSLPYPPHGFPVQPSSLAFLSTLLPLSQNPKISHPSLSLHAMIMSWYQVQHTMSTAYTEYIIYHVEPRPKIVCLSFILIILGWPLTEL
jgi:hypothetical protein